MEHEQSLKKLMDNKAKLEEYEAEISRNQAKRDALLDQAKQRYGVNSFTELEEYMNTVYKKYEVAKQEVDKYNSQLEAFFSEM